MFQEIEPSWIDAKVWWPKAVILLDCTQVHKFTKEPLGTISIRWCLLFPGGFVGAWTTQMHKYANVQTAVPT